MTLPVILLGLVIAFLIGSLFHAWRGGDGWRFLLSLALSALGFALGQAAGIWLEVALFRVGALDVGLGTIGSVLFLFAGDWLSRVKPPDESGV